jgi:2-polyprenyl-6-methoxyphenol hydroxylase-like FAD-dependent oxidoreductase
LETFSQVPEFADYAKRLIRATPDGGIVNWPLLWRDPQEKTVSPLGRVVQAGDAAHTFLPSSGSGVNQGIEDAIYLASCLHMGGSNDVAAATQVYSKLR